MDERADQLAREVFSERIERRGELWVSPDYKPHLEIWNELANENEIHAAISSPNEAREVQKSGENFDFILEHAAPGARLLDLGCGYGRWAKYLLPHRTFGVYIGVDSSQVMLRKFHERYASSLQEQATPLLLVNADIDALPLRDASIDCCIVSAVFLHNHKDVTRASIAEIRRVLKPGGKLLVISSFPNAHGLTGLQGWAFLTYLKLIGQGKKNGPVRYFGQQEVRSLFGDFRKIDICPYGFSVLPKTILGLPRSWQKPYRRFYEWVHAILKKRLSTNRQARSCTHFDVVAEA